MAGQINGVGLNAHVTVSRMSKMVERTLDFLELFADQKRPLSLTEISRLVNTPISSCHDVLQSLEARGYIYELVPRSGYYPTRRLFDIAKIIAEHDPIVSRAEIVLQALMKSIDETVLLCKASGVASTYLLAIEPSHPLRFMVNIGESIRNLYATSAGKALIAGWSDEALDAFLSSAHLEPLTANTLTSPAALRENILQGRARGWFLNNEESLAGVTTLSASFNWNSAIFIVTIAGPSSRLQPRLDWVSTQLLDACAQLRMRASR
jgi:DNA-binding IclR family transcriptional regulator